ncbi:hypothetical protein L4D77_29225 [Photobacterium frigidiphilum]|uniref:hypothetical protein n=1 Tax=Photobacterium frigidiphilum TaxID=264736 RepID=UPI003D0F3914
MKLLEEKYMKYLCCIVFLLPIMGCSTVDYTGTITVKGKTVAAEATYEEVDYLKDPIIRIEYDLAGESYHTRFMSSFGDKVIYKPRSIIVYNNGDNKQQNYYFEGHE